MHFMCRGGSQNLREWKKEDFSVCTDSSGVRYVCKVKDELTRNWRENNEAQKSQCLKLVGLFAQFFHLKNVTCLNLRNEYLFQRPKKGVDESDKVWYDKMLVGQRTLAEKMKKLSIEAKLSCVYMNHSITATMITKLDESGYEAQHIMAVSGHRNESSIRSYSSQASLSVKRKMSETLSKSLSNKKTVKHSEIPATQWSNDKTIIELGYRKISWFVRV